MTQVGCVTPVGLVLPTTAEPILKREVAAVDALGNPTDIDSVEAEASETFSHDADYHWLTSAETDSGAGTHPYLAEDYVYTAAALGLRERKETLLASGHVLNALSTYATGTSRLVELVNEDWDGTTHDATLDTKEERDFTAHGAVDTIRAYERPSGQTTGWDLVGTATSTFDEEGRRTGYDGTGYGYDHRWLRTRKTVGTVPWEYWHGDGGQLVAESTCTSPTDCTWPRPLQEYVWLAGEPVALIESALPATGSPVDTGAAVKWVHNGLLGEPRRVTDTGKNVLWSRDLPPFGWTDPGENQQTVSVGGTPVVTTLNLGLPGQYQDAETGLMYNWHRYYSPGLGTYMESDPLLSNGEYVQLQSRPEIEPLDPYAYAESSPLTRVDRTGLHPGVAVGVGIGLYCQANPAACERAAAAAAAAAAALAGYCMAKAKQCSCTCGAAGSSGRKNIGRMPEFECRAACPMLHGFPYNEYTCD